MRSYKIAGHIVAIESSNETETDDLLPNFAPFACENDSPPILTVSIENDAAWPQDVAEIGHFDVNGCMHGIYRTGEGGYIIDVCDSTGCLCSRMLTDTLFTHCRVCLRSGTKAQRKHGINNCLMIAYAFSTAAMDTILIHASVIRCNGRGYLMTAPSGTGKSTHTYLWYTTIPGCDLMNDDNPVIRISTEGQAMVYGSPWSGKTRCYRNVEAPIGGIVSIKRRQENSIRRLAPLEAFTMLLPACSNMKWDARIYNCICDNITKFIQLCDIWELGCLPDSAAATLCHDTICQKDSI